MLEGFYTPNAEFKVWSTQHWYWLLFAILNTAVWIYLGKRAKSESEQQRIGWYMSLVGVLVWIYAELLMVGFDQMNKQSMLPLHLCYFLNLTLPFMIRWRSFQAFDVVYPILMAGCLQALFTPDLHSGFPHFHNLRYFIVHIGLVQMALYPVFVYGFRPTFSSVWKCLIFFNIYALFVTPFNLMLNTNFMYLREKPPGTILDFFGDWPYYLFSGQLLSLTLFFIVWLPFGAEMLFRRWAKASD